MISPWYNLNFKGKCMTVGCLINLTCAIVMAIEGHNIAIFSIMIAALCGLSTFLPHYQHQDAKDINDGREK